MYMCSTPCSFAGALRDSRGMLVAPTRPARVLQRDRERLRQVGAAMLCRMLGAATRGDRATLQVRLVHALREVDAATLVEGVRFGGAAERLRDVVTLRVGRGMQVTGGSLLGDAVLARHRVSYSETGEAGCSFFAGTLGPLDSCRGVPSPSAWGRERGAA